LKGRGRIAAALLKEGWDMAEAHDGEPAWLAIAVRPLAGTFSAYFGLVADLGNRRSIAMTPAACARHECLMRNGADERITADLRNV
jgi:hypothetical protein